MKKMTKRIILFTLVFTMTVSFLPTTVSAARVGDVIGYAQPTDIVTYINGYQIESYNVKGYTYICVEDLAYYGFDVYYDGNSRSLHVSRSPYPIDPQNTNPNFWAIGKNNKRTNILYTDINTYLLGNWVQSSNINGRTIINFEDLAMFGNVSYDNERRELTLVIDNGENGYNYLHNFAIEAQKNYYNNDWYGAYKAKGDVLYCIGTAKTYMSQQTINDYIYNKYPTDKSDLQKSLYELKEMGFNISSVYFEIRNSNGAYITSCQLY